MVDFIKFTKHACAGSSKLKATTAGHIYNILIEQDLDNGSVVAKGDYVKPEVYKAKDSTGFAGKLLMQLQTEISMQKLKIREMQFYCCKFL